MGDPFGDLPRAMRTTVQIRKAGAGDELALSLVGQASFLEAFADVLKGSDVVEHCVGQHAAEKYRGWLGDGRTQVWLAETPTGAPVGYLVLAKPELPLADLSERDLEVKRVYLLHRFQGGGVGARLMELARAHAQAEGAARLLLGVYAKNTPAILFYERLGYVAVGTREFRVGAHTYHDLILALPLKAG